MNMDSVPKRTWKRIIMKLCFIVILLIFCSPSASNASHDPWGENLQPKLHTDYLNEYSGKKKKYYFHTYSICKIYKVVLIKVLLYIKYLTTMGSNFCFMTAAI